jgi:hypothetical protein
MKLESPPRPRPALSLVVTKVKRKKKNEKGEGNRIPQAIGARVKKKKHE